MGLNDQELLLEESGPKFDPPLYLQRYTKVRQLLQSEDIIKVADFGCSNGKFTRYLKNLKHCKEISLIDIHYGSLIQTENIARPLAWDYLQKRDNPLEIMIYQGSIAEKDRRLKNYDAVTLIELIEHLNPDTLEEFPEVLFDYIKPKIVIITTPNQEFNCLFPDQKEFRHWDHKFEWTRQELQNWAGKIVKKYPDYEAGFDGIGDAPEDKKHLGACTQLVIFKRKNDETHENDYTKEPYKLINKFEYPGKNT